MAKLLSREPWRATRPLPGQNELDVEWGYLELYEHNHFVFVHERPSDREIFNRKGCRIPDAEDKKAC